MACPTTTRICRVLLGLAVVVCLGHAWYHLTWRGLHGASDDLLMWTDVRWDHGPLSWLSWLAMFLVGWTALRLAGARPIAERAWWWLVGGTFLYLSLDDALMIHERVGGHFFHHAGGLFVYGWIVVMLPLFAIAGALIFFFLFRVLRGTPRELRRMVLGFVCLGLAVVLEAGEMKMKDSGWRFRGFAVTEYTQLLEEFLEALGPLLLLGSLGNLLHGTTAAIPGPPGPTEAS